MLRVMHLRTVVGTGGGPEKTILSSPQHLKECEVELVYIHPKNDPNFNLTERAAERGAKLVDIPESGGFDPRTIFKLRKEIARFRPNILHAHDYKTNFLAALCRPKSAVILTTAHGYGVREGRLELYYHLDKVTLKTMNHIIAVSEDIRDQILEMSISPEKITIIDNAIDEVEYSRGATIREAKTNLGFEQGQFLIGAVGRLSDEKGFDLLIEAVTRLIEAGLNVGLAIIGEGVERERLEKQIAESGHLDRIQLLGYRSDTKSLYEAMDLYVLSSHREGLPNVVLEAMAMEVPVVATRIAGIPKLVQDRENGLLVEAGEVSQIESAIREIMLNPELRERLTRNARETIENEFSFSVRMEKVRAIYDKLLSNSTNPK